ncbi:MAG: Crp/Fnr family transcriptional regulator [Saprospiraceae bacterium]|nr:Crp/Fnr family transcriptional regulator [Saprospiraceae bacterium]
MNNLWYFDQFDFYKILCPYKYEEHLKQHPNQGYKKHDFLFFEKDAAKEIILIDRGKVKIGHYDNDGQEYVIAILGKGEILGQTALLGETKHRQFAEVIEDGTQVCKMSVDKARELTRDYVPFAIEINRRIGEHIRRLERRIEILLFKDVRLRLVEFLKDMAETYGRPKNSGFVFDHSLTQSDIAMLIGASRKSASLLLNDLEDEGFIQFNRKQIFIPNLQALEQAAQRKAGV